MTGGCCESARACITSPAIKIACYLIIAGGGLPSVSATPSLSGPAPFAALSNSAARRCVCPAPHTSRTRPCWQTTALRYRRDTSRRRLALHVGTTGSGNRRPAAARRDGACFRVSSARRAAAFVWPCEQLGFAKCVVLADNLVRLNTCCNGGTAGCLSENYRPQHWPAGKNPSVRGRLNHRF